MRHVGNAGPYRLQCDASLALESDVQHTDRPPSFHLSWLPVPGVAFAIHAIVGRAPKPHDDRKWTVIVDGAQAETASQFFATQLRDIDGTIGDGVTFAGRRLAGLGGRYQGHAVIAEHYVGRAYDDIVDLVYRFHAAQIQRAVSWGLLFHSLVLGAIVDRVQ
jgi:hypothetical protein